MRRETPEERVERLCNEKEETTSLVREVPRAFDFQLVGEEIVDGRQAYVLQATPHLGYQAQGKYGKMFSKLEGKLWVDKQDLGAFARKLELKSVHAPHYKPGTELCSLEMAVRI